MVPGVRLHYIFEVGFSIFVTERSYWLSFENFLHIPMQVKTVTLQPETIFEFVFSKVKRALGSYRKISHNKLRLIQSILNNTESRFGGLNAEPKIFTPKL